MLMAYDYHWRDSATSGPVAPLAGWGTYNVSWSIQDHLTWGTPANKLLLGVPYYGYRWNTASGAAGAATTPPGTAVTYALAQAALPTQEELWDAPSQTAWMRTQNPGWQQTWFDDANSLAAKYQTVVAQGLAGVGIWALGYDDPHTALWNELHAAFDQVTSDADAVGDTRTLHVVSGNPFSTSVQLVSQYMPATVLQIFDVRGRLIRTSPPQTISMQTQRFYWDGRTSAGVAAPCGVYLAVTSSSRQGVRLIKSR
jgi:hypothetical protein